MCSGCFLGVLWVCSDCALGDLFLVCSGFAASVVVLFFGRALSGLSVYSQCILSVLLVC